MNKKVWVRAPASTANLGPGFDCLGMALGLYHRLTVVEEKGCGVVVRVRGEGMGELPLNQENVVCQALMRGLAESGYQPQRLVLESKNEIPLACGLGSSAAALLAGLAAGWLLSGQSLDRRRLIELALSAERHPDNIVSSALGGFTVAVASDGQVQYLRLEPPASLQVVVAVPDFRLPTCEARAVLPEQIPFADAVANLGRVGLLTAGLASGRLEVLRTAMEDRLHQPYRAPLVKGMEQVRQAALAAGALGAALSGAGPAMMALVVDGAATVGQAMKDAWAAAGVAARIAVLLVDREGVGGSVKCEV